MSVSFPFRGLARPSVARGDQSGDAAVAARLPEGHLLVLPGVRALGGQLVAEKETTKS